ncbi:hypothetical protein PR202_gb27248 [Eleusine coracana subsp. coracana]|uniref:Uncharacterized protein n=1 Tax=Eleusine coracana subsp. coracana TaxID=191504 RepID=A0AAV5FTZ9_ELECO|nr:hypothetical protein PR202_gb27248 [Eleusine coracana subsp. coracana]
MGTGRTILVACKYYMEGASSSNNNAPKPVPSRANALMKRDAFTTSLKTLFEDLLMESNVKGVDTRKFVPCREVKRKNYLPEKHARLIGQ